MKLGVKTPAALIISSVTLDCAAAQWISTRFANTTDETSGEVDLRCRVVSPSYYTTHLTQVGKGWDGTVSTMENVPYCALRDRSSPNDNTLCNLEIAGFVELVSARGVVWRTRSAAVNAFQVAAQFISTTIDKHAEL
ncbi:hypothetical protein EDD16DRAFT_853010 [Pisolithus croceorrhizus]|nr:hypothetical protein EV401DRAFT_797592 [Pisolithus croceorrhizus]KAI6131386.1 hypothetical protein EDD16DRAFT_853010 [Pisolithus croceorrhizus]